MPADRTAAGPSRRKSKYALPPIAGAGDEADVHAARTRKVAVGAVDLLEDDRDEEDADGDNDDEGSNQGAELGEKGSDNPRKKKKKTPGVIYISRVPPGMTPHKVRHLMAKWGEVGRVYAQRRDAVAGYNPNHHKKKERHRSANFNEAWVEFMDKSLAKTVARMLNAQPIGGKRGDRWRDDIWTMKYLSGFKWEMLGEQVAYERQVHQSRLRAEMQRAKTEQNAYLQNVELARVLKKREERRTLDTGGNEGVTAPSSSKGKKDEASKSNGAQRSYRQREVADHAHGLAAKGMDDVLGNLF